MKLLTLTYEEFLRLLKVFAAVALGFAALFLIARWHLLGAWSWSTAWQPITASLTLTAFVFGVLANMTWDSPRLARWLSHPTVHGVWLGQLNSNYKAPEGGSAQPIDIVFVIKQTYLTVSIESFTKTQDGGSTLEALVRNVKTNTTELRYVFELRRYFKGENRHTAGCGELRLVDSGRRLKGHYWTNSPTQGNIELQLKTRDCSRVESYEAAERLWMKAQPSQGSAARGDAAGSA
jgi:hypothetical protein